VALTKCFRTTAIDTNVAAFHLAAKLSSNARHNERRGPSRERGHVRGGVGHPDG
jgi:hypothetical protein